MGHLESDNVAKHNLDLNDNGLDSEGSASVTIVNSVDLCADSK